MNSPELPSRAANIEAQLRAYCSQQSVSADALPAPLRLALDFLSELSRNDRIETYAVLSLSSAHLSDRALSDLNGMNSNMIVKRDTGVFIVLGENETSDQFLTSDCDAMKILRYAHQGGYRMVEFDSNAVTLPHLFRVFER